MPEPGETSRARRQRRPRQRWRSDCQASSPKLAAVAAATLTSSLTSIPSRSDNHRGDYRCCDRAVAVLPTAPSRAAGTDDLAATTQGSGSVRAVQSHDAAMPAPRCDASVDLWVCVGQRAPSPWSSIEIDGFPAAGYAWNAADPARGPRHCPEVSRRHQANPELDRLAARLEQSQRESRLSADGDVVRDRCYGPATTFEQ